MVTVAKIIACLNSTNHKRQLYGIEASRKILCNEGSLPIDLLIQNGIVPIAVRLLKNDKRPVLQLEAAWVLTNIAAGTSKQTASVIEQNAVPLLVALLKSENLEIKTQAVWALANIAGDGAAARDIVIRHNVIDGILQMIDDKGIILQLHNISWLISNLCRYNNPYPPFEQMKRLLPIIAQLLYSDDVQVRSDSCWALSYLTEYSYKYVHAVVHIGVVSLLVTFLGSDETRLVVPALRSIGNIITSTDELTDIVINAGAIPKLAKLLQHPKSSIVKEAIWALSNITAGNQDQIQAVMDAEIFFEMRKILECGDLKCKKEAAWTIANVIASGIPENLIDLFEKYNLLKPFTNLLDSKDTNNMKLVLAGLLNTFIVGMKLGGVQNLCETLKQIGVLDKIKALQQHENEEIRMKAKDIIETYFRKDVENAFIRELKLSQELQTFENMVLN